MAKISLEFVINWFQGAFEIVIEKNSSSRCRFGNGGGGRKREESFIEQTRRGLKFWELGPLKS